MSANRISHEDYERLKTFLVCYLDWFVPGSQKSQNPEDQPRAFLERLEKASLSNAKKGLQMAINDTIEATLDWLPQRVAEADARFAAAGTFTMSEVRQRYSKQYAQILKRGEIRSEAEYYLLKALVDSGILVPHLGDSQRAKVILDTFEAGIIRR